MGSGEFQGLSNNLRAIVAALTPVLYGNVYAALQERGLDPSLTWLLPCVLGSLLPQYIQSSIPDGEFEAAAPNARTKVNAEGGREGSK